jgi:hypothetical protein
MTEQPPVRTVSPGTATAPGMQRVQCMSCLAMAEIPEGVDAGSVTWCGCCAQDHDHGQAAASCPGNGGAGHAGAACTRSNPLACTVITPAGEDCPGGHCGLRVEGCAVCRPVVHYGMPVALQLGA